MDKREMVDALGDFSQQLLMTLAEVEAIKKSIQAVIDENTALSLENSRLRERIAAESKSFSRNNAGKKNLEHIYQEGFHICNEDYAKRLDEDATCLFCIELLNREVDDEDTEIL